ncbi:fimbrial protein [Pseudomonas putida]|uniref:fimbrial protein n=1 Tax=Pseudomonas putida TaxID=303 RepID=UPI0023640729|nr:fimbrial protein [Pseudomonas putida]MDD2052098.1 fimbrial protein [Pseudomonas putida]
MPKIIERRRVAAPPSRSRGLLLLLLFSVSALFSSYSYAVFECSVPNKIIKFTSNYIRPYQDAAYDETLGFWSVNSTFNCQGGKPGDVFSLRMNFLSSSSTETVCSNASSIVGLRFRREDGAPFRCASLSRDSQEVFRAVATGQPSYPTFNQPDFIEGIKIKTRWPLQPGAQNLKYEFRLISFIAYVNGVKQPNNYFVAQADTTDFVVSSCTLSTAPITVPFGEFSLADLATLEIPFDITMGNCSGLDDARDYNNTMRLKFTSNRLLPDGSIDINECQTCAQGLAIEVSTRNNRRLNLNNRYDLRNGVFTLSEKGISHHFKARLKRTTIPLKPGTVDSVLTYIVTSV